MDDLSPHLRVKLIPVLQEIRNQCLRRGLRGLIDLRRVLGAQYCTPSTGDSDKKDEVSFTVVNITKHNQSATTVDHNGSNNRHHIIPHMEAEQLKHLLSEELGVTVSNHSVKLICVGFQGDSGYIDLAALCSWVCGFSLPPHAEEGVIRRQAVINLFHRLDTEGQGVVGAATLLAAVDPAVENYRDESIHFTMTTPEGGRIAPIPQDQLLHEVLLPPPHPADEEANQISFHSRYYSEFITKSEFVSYYAAVSDNYGGDTEGFLAALHLGWVLPPSPTTTTMTRPRQGEEGAAAADAHADRSSDIAAFVKATVPEMLRSRPLPGRCGNHRPHLSTLGSGVYPSRPETEGHKMTEKVAGYCGHVPMAQARFGETFQVVLDKVPNLSAENRQMHAFLNSSYAAQNTCRPDPILKKMSTANVHSFKLA